MTTKTEPVRASDWLKMLIDDEWSVDAVTILSGQNLASGAVVGQITKGAATGAAVAGNTGDGTITASPTVGAGAKVGVYRLVCIEPATNLGKFEVEDPDGNVIGVATVGTQFTTHLTFTIADGAQDFVSGDQFTITVAAGSGKWKASPNTGTDGAETAAGVLLHAVDASGGDKPGVVVRRLAVVTPFYLAYDSSVDDDTKKGVKKTQLNANGIFVREGA